MDVRFSILALCVGTMMSGHVLANEEVAEIDDPLVRAALQEPVKAIGFAQSEYEYRYFKYDMKNAPKPQKYDAIERNWKILQSGFSLTEDTSLYVDLRKIDYLDDQSGSMKKTGWGWDHEASLTTSLGNAHFFGKEWKVLGSFGWEGDWNYSSQGASKDKLNWSSADYYLWSDFKTTFDNGITPWDNGKHSLTFRPLLVEYIDFGVASKFHKPGDNHVTGNRNQFLSVFISSQWTDRLSTVFTFRNYADFLAGEGMQYHIGTEDYLTYTLLKTDIGFYADWYNKLELYAFMDDSDKTAKDRFTEFYTRLRIGYQHEFKNKVNVHAYVGQDLWNYHYNDRPWIGGEYGRNETIGALKISVPLGGR